jgi:hypothetical protein
LNRPDEISCSDINRLRVDTHVHFHSCYDEAEFLDEAAANLIPDIENPDSLLAAICLTETASADWYAELYGALSAGADRDNGWAFEATEESNSILALNRKGEMLAIIAGRQVRCQEGLEVLAIGHADKIPDGGSVRQVMLTVSESGCVPVLPWGFGKWQGRRAQIVTELLRDPPCKFAVGDNGGRLAVLGEPALLAKARSLGFPVLPGSDPFPFTWDGRRVGTYGIEFEGELDVCKPFQSLKRLAFGDANSTKMFGGLESIPHFIRNQLAIQVHNLQRRWRG